MNKKKFAFVALLLAACSKKPVKTSQIVPVDFPQNTGVKDFQFPESKEKIYDWINAEDDNSVTDHAWGIWAGLTQKTGQQYNGQDLYVYDTWNGVGELADAAARGDRGAGCNVARSSRTTLRKPKQFAHAGLLGDPNVDTDYAILETVSYSPSAACFATSNLIFNKSVLDSYKVKGGISKISDFPVTAITTKPTYYVTKAKSGLVRVPAWTKTPEPAKAFGHKAWGNYVYVDLDNKQDPGKKLVPVTSESPTQEQIAAATCNRTDFISYTLDAAAADYLNKHQDRGNDPSHQFQAGSVALLVAMHVTTKEIQNWTWQTYFWVSDPKNPGAPSSPDISALMPSELQSPANHYAVSPAYAMVYPNQPIEGGTGKDTHPIIAYNPYLEAGFGPKVFKQPNKQNPDFQYGVQTNCASCHALATASGNLGYSTAQYIDMADMMFKDDVQLDFAWSVQGNINTDK